MIKSGQYDSPIRASVEFYIDAIIVGFINLLTLDFFSIEGIYRSLFGVLFVTLLVMYPFILAGFIQRSYALVRQESFEAKYSLYVSELSNEKAL